MVYDEDGQAPTTGPVQEKDSVQEAKQKKEENRTRKDSKTKGRKGKSNSSKKRKKPTQHSHSEGNEETHHHQPAGGDSTIEQPSKQPRVERDPYEFTESQSNKAPTPTKQRIGVTTGPTLTRRRLHERDQAHSSSHAMVAAVAGGDINEGAAGTSKDARTHGEDGLPAGGSKDPTADKGQDQRASMPPNQQQTPPAKNDGEEEGDQVI